MNIGAILKDELNRKNMRVSELSKITNISSQTLYAIIKRNSNRIKIDTLKKISDALDVPISTFMKDNSLDIISNEFVNELKTRFGNTLNDEEIRIFLTSERYIEALIVKIGYDLIYSDDDDMYYLIKDDNAYKIHCVDINRIKEMLLSYLKYIIFDLLESSKLEKIKINDLNILINNTED